MILAILLGATTIHTTIMWILKDNINLKTHTTIMWMLMDNHRLMEMHRMLLKVHLTMKKDMVTLKKTPCLKKNVRVKGSEKPKLKLGKNKTVFLHKSADGKKTWSKQTKRDTSSTLKTIIVNDTQMTIGATTIEHKENRTMSQVNQVLHMMGMTEMEEITTAMLSLTVATVLQVKIVSPTMAIEMQLEAMEDRLLTDTMRLMMMMIDHLPAATTEMRKNSMASSNSTCQSSTVTMIRRNISSGLKRWTRSSVSITTPKLRR